MDILESLEDFPVNLCEDTSAHLSDLSILEKVMAEDSKQIFDPMAELEQQCQPLHLKISSEAACAPDLVASDCSESGSTASVPTVTCASEKDSPSPFYYSVSYTHLTLPTKA